MDRDLVEVAGQLPPQCRFGTADERDSLRNGMHSSGLLTTKPA